jgi:ABC-type uncharacterized transport system auxiliary subunit
MALLLVATGCLGGKTLPTHYYLPHLPPAETTPSGGSAEGLEIGVAAFHVDAPYDGDRIVYRVGADSPEVGFYAYHRWAAPLGRTLPILVAERFAGAAGIASIEPALPGRRYGARLEGRVRVLEEVDAQAGPGARVRLWLALVEAGGEEIWSSELDAEAPAAAPEMRAVVEAMGQALADALARGRRDLEQALAR